MLDSGSGGFTVLAAIAARLRNIEVIYYADTAYVPYGDRPLADIAFLGNAIARHLQTYDPAAMVVASGSTCAAFDACGWPETAARMVGVVDPGARAAVANSKSRAIAVVATSATVASRIFDRAIMSIAPDARVTGVPAPALVPIVESGESKSERARRAVATVCRPILGARCDTVILGCTHFPHLQEWFEEALGPDVAIIDPALGTADEVVQVVGAGNAGTSRLIVEVSGSADDFAANAKQLSDMKIDELRQVDPVALGVRSNEIVERR